jgi:hypothetical protein
MLAGDGLTISTLLQVGNSPIRFQILTDFVFSKNVSYSEEACRSEFTAPIFQQAFRNCENSDDEAWQNGGLTRSEEVITDAEGNERVYDVIKVPLYHDDNARKGLVVFGRDITDAKRAEAKVISSLNG